MISYVSQAFVFACMSFSEPFTVDLPPAPDPPLSSQSHAVGGETDLRENKAPTTVAKTLEPALEEWYHGDLMRKQVSDFFNFSYVRVNVSSFLVNQYLN